MTRGAVPATIVAALVLLVPHAVAAQGCTQLVHAVPSLCGTETTCAELESYVSLHRLMSAPSASRSLVYWEALTRLALNPYSQSKGDDVIRHAAEWERLAQARHDEIALVDARLALAAAELSLGKLDVALARLSELASSLGRTTDTADVAVAAHTRASALRRMGDVEGARVALRDAIAAGARSARRNPTSPWRCDRRAGTAWSRTRRLWAWELELLEDGDRSTRTTDAATQAWVYGGDTGAAPIAVEFLVQELDRGRHAARTRNRIRRVISIAEQRWPTVDDDARDVVVVGAAIADLEMALGVAAARDGRTHGALDLFRSALMRSTRRFERLAGSPRRVAHTVERLREHHEQRLLQSLRGSSNDPQVTELLLELACQRRGAHAGATPDCVSFARPLSERLQAQLAEHRIERLIEPLVYRVDDETVAAILSLGRNGPPRWRELGPLAEIVEARDELVRAAARPAGPTSRTATRLTRLLFHEEGREARQARIAVVSDAFLRHIPFLALRDARGPWVERRTVVVLSGARDLLARETPTPGGVVAMGAPDLERARLPAPRAREARVAGRWAPLPGARAETLRVASLFPDTQLYLGAAATEEAFRSLFRVDRTHPPPRLLHLATHGGADGALEGSTWRSGGRGFLMFTPGRGAGENEDGFVSAAEITSDDDAFVGTDLVVLSACESGTAVPESRSGIDGLRRAFLAVGAASVMSTLWTIDDEATRALVGAFYEALRRGADRHDAVRIAARHVRRRWPHPYYWGAFQMLGRPGRVAPPQDRDVGP